MKLSGGWRSLRGLAVALCSAPLVLACQSRASSKTGQGLSGDPEQPTCGFEVVEAPRESPRDACLDSPVVAGPVTYTRTTGAPPTSTLPFSLTQTSDVCVRVSNGDGSRQSRVASAELAIDGEIVIAPSQFNPGVELIEYGGKAQSGPHQLDTRLAGRPGSRLTVEVRAGAESSRHNAVSGDNGVLQVHGLNADPAVFSPRDTGPGASSQVSLLVDFFAPIPGNAGRSTYALEVDFEIASAASCASVVNLTATMALATPSRTRMSAAWDGRDQAGDTAADGVYFYRATARLFAERADGSRALLDVAVSQIQVLQVAFAPERAVGFDGVSPMIYRDLVADQAQLAAAQAARARATDPVARATHFLARSTNALLVVAQSVTPTTRTIGDPSIPGGSTEVPVQQTRFLPIQNLTGVVDDAFTLRLRQSPHHPTFKQGARYILLLVERSGGFGLMMQFAEQPDGSFSDSGQVVPRATLFTLLGG